MLFKVEISRFFVTNLCIFEKKFTTITGLTFETLFLSFHCFSSGEKKAIFRKDSFVKTVTFEILVVTKVLPCFNCTKMTTVKLHYFVNDHVIIQWIYVPNIIAKFLIIIAWFALRSFFLSGTYLCTTLENVPERLT